MTRAPSVDQSCGQTTIPRDVEDPDSEGMIDPEPPQAGQQALTRIDAVTRVPLSDVRWCHLEPFHLKEHSLGRIMEGAIDGMMSNILRRVQRSADVESESQTIFQEDGILKLLDGVEVERLWKARSTSMDIRGQLEHLQTSVSRKSEDWARQVINVLLRAAKAEFGSRILCQPEMTLATEGSSSKESEVVDDLGKWQKWDCPKEGFTREVLSNPGTIVKGTRVLELTGSVDFMLLNVPGDMPYRRYYEALRKGFTLDRAVAILGLSQSDPKSPHTIVLPIEAKRMDEDEDIQKNLPQVLAQTLLSMRKAGRRRMGWVLSNGDKWVFGVCSTDERSWRCIYFYTGRMMGEIRSRQPTKEELDDTMTQARIVMKALLVWSHTNASLLWDVVLWAFELKQKGPKSERNKSSKKVKPKACKKPR